ncbi:MAG: YihY/virulence factor BrkB family protein [Anaerolineales bacterium]|nr:YihY/virulence factor BrkB family protein [Anaerolineales bacterium]
MQLRVRRLALNIYHSLCHLVGEIVAILKEAIETFTRERGAQAAAGMAYYALFSLFPLLLLFVAGGSYLIEGEDASHRVVEIVTQVLPVSTSLLEENIRQVLQRRGAFSVVGVIGLLWAATSVFSALAYHINLAWPEAKKRNFVQKRLTGLGMVGVLSVFFLLSILATTINKILPTIQASIFGSIPIYSSIWERYLPSLLNWGLVFVMFLALYRWTPATQVSWRAAIWAGMVVALLWQLAASAFTWYLRVGLGRYELIYGSLGAVVALLVLVYIISWITLFGAHICAAIMHHYKE